MKIVNLKLQLILIAILTYTIPSCTRYSTDLNEMEKLQISHMDDIQKGKSCSKNLFGSFTLPYFGDTAIRLSGKESVIDAIKDGNITKIYAVDTYSKNYVFYSKRCTVVFGQ